jgi:TolB-like protein/class 3 adenylate cyclase/Tfp pilus assembly protein PilF
LLAAFYPHREFERRLGERFDTACFALRSHTLWLHRTVRPEGWLLLLRAGSRICAGGRALGARRRALSSAGRRRRVRLRERERRMPDSLQRRLAGILSADAVGYSQAMAEDEAATIRAIAAARVLMTARVVAHHGRVVDAPGDNLLAEFPSVVDAVACAVEIQHEIEAAPHRSDERSLRFRIGVNLGDVVVEGDHIYGDGVNVAARLEALAEPGGICISASAVEQVEGKLPLRFVDGGEHAVKNIPKPVRIYRVVAEAPGLARGAGGGRSSRLRLALLAILPLAGVAAALVLSWPRPLAWLVGWAGLDAPTERPSLPAKPSIAVLPLHDLSGDPTQSWFAEALTSELVMGLGRSPTVFVISNLSSLSYLEQRPALPEVGRELGVRYVLEGTTQRAESRVRVTTRLSEAASGRQLWSQRYDREFGELFDLQVEIAAEILTAVGARIEAEELRRIEARPVTQLDAFDAYLKGQRHFYRFTRADHESARGLLERAVDEDPGSAPALSLLAGTYLLEYGFGWNLDAVLLDRAEALVERALEIDPLASEAHTARAGIHLWRGRSEDAVAEAERAVQLSPNSDRCYAMRGAALAADGRYLEAARSLQMALRLNPRAPAPYWLLLAYLNQRAGRGDDALRFLERVREASPDDLLARTELAIHYAGAGQPEDARSVVEEMIRVNPQLTARSAAELRSRAFRRDDTEEAVAALQQAGLP